ncbi:MAG: hypothetical protein U9P42_05260 [Candidatus Fermentibacteria bacterium]|nr:hypothetical protein [Candidatus Fermentibacteria bacterium]
MTPGLIERVSERKAYFILASGMILWYFYSAFVATQVRYGFNQIGRLGLPIASAVAVVAAGLIYLIKRRDITDTAIPEPIPLRKLWLPAFASALLLMPLFWFLKNGFINADGLYNMQSLISRVSILHHDEMLTTLLITRLWESGICGIHPEASFSMFSVVWGGFYVWVTVILGGRLTGRRWPLFLILCFASGFVQLFFGDVEFYAMVAALTSLYLLLSLEHLRGRISIIFPGLVLIFAILSHLLAGWLLPSYLFLFIRGLKRKEFAATLTSAFVMLIVAGFVFVIVTDAGLPIRAITRSHAMGSADKGFLDMLTQPSISYYASVTNVLFLLFPFWFMIPLLIIYRRLYPSPYNVTVGICVVMLLLLAFVWNLGLGPYFDWNLIATIGVPASILVWGNLLQAPWIRGIRTAVWVLLLAGGIHSWVWISGNSLEFSFLPREHLGPLLESTSGSVLFDHRGPLLQNGHNPLSGDYQ